MFLKHALQQAAPHSQWPDENPNNLEKNNLNRVSPSLLVGHWQMKDFIPTLNIKTKRFLPKTSCSKG
jgi:hypothetical protein